MKGAQFCRECGCRFPPMIGEGHCKRPLMGRWSWLWCWSKWSFSLWWRRM